MLECCNKIPLNQGGFIVVQKPQFMRFSKGFTCILTAAYRVWYTCEYPASITHTHIRTYICLHFNRVKQIRIKQRGSRVFANVATFSCCCCCFVDFCIKFFVLFFFFFGFSLVSKKVCFLCIIFHCHF